MEGIAYQGFYSLSAISPVEIEQKGATKENAIARENSATRSNVLSCKLCKVSNNKSLSHCERERETLSSNSALGALGSITTRSK